MSIYQEIVKMCGAKLYKLRYDGEIVAMRLEHYNTDKRSYEYYDFYKETIQDRGIKEYLNKNSSTIETVDLIEYKDRLVTQVELENRQLVVELKDKEEIEEKLNQHILRREAGVLMDV